MAETLEEVAAKLDIPVGIRARRVIASALRAQYVAGLEACLAIADRIRLESGAPTHSTAGMVAAEIRELAEQAKREGT